jgi:hypothetical protein
MLKENEEYEYSERSEQIIRLHWPDYVKPESPGFQFKMMEMQIQLIEGHRLLMREADRARADATISYLRHRLRHQIQ